MNNLFLNESLSISMPTEWTQSAKECYNRKLICKNCQYNNLFESTQCKMKYSVMKLFSRFGKPT